MYRPKHVATSSWLGSIVIQFLIFQKKKMFLKFSDLGEFPPVEPNDYEAKAFRGVRVDCNTPPYFPGEYNHNP